MNRLEFSITIQADNSTIWRALWDDVNYRDWAGVFFEGSYYVADNLSEGSKVMFLGPDQGGIFSFIQKHIPNKIIQFKHIGKVVAGKEEPLDEETRVWTGATETYSIVESANSNMLVMEIDVLDEHLEFMSAKVPEALERISKTCSST